MVLDVREAAEFAEYPLITGAVHIPLTELPTRLTELPDDQPIAVVCRAGGRSAKAVQFLQAAGYQVANVLGGMQEWDKL